MGDPHWSSQEVKIEKRLKMGELLEMYHFDIVSDELIEGLLIFLSEKFKTMSDKEKDKHYEIGLAKITEREKIELNKERKNKFYDPKTFPERLRLF